MTLYRFPYLDLLKDNDRIKLQQIIHSLLDGIEYHPRNKKIVNKVGEWIHNPNKVFDKKSPCFLIMNGNIDKVIEVIVGKTWESLDDIS